MSSPYHEQCGRTADLNALRERLEVLEAEADIRRLISEHEWVSDWGTDAVDLPDWAGEPAQSNSPARIRLWSPNGVFESSGLSEMFDVRGPAADDEGFTAPGGAAGFTAPRHEWLPHMMHFLTNERIEILTPVSATGRWYSWETSTAVVDGLMVAIWIAGRYIFDFAKEDAIWKITKMHFQEIFSTPFDSAGWTEVPHVPYGPGQVTTTRY